MNAFQIVEYNRTIAIITERPTPDTFTVFYQSSQGFETHGVNRSEVLLLDKPEKLTKAVLLEAIQLYQSLLTLIQDLKQ